MGFEENEDSVWICKDIIWLEHYLFSFHSASFQVAVIRKPVLYLNEDFALVKKCVSSLFRDE